MTDIELLCSKAEADCAPAFESILKVYRANTEKVMDAFAECKVSENLFAGTAGYGYDDRGRDTLDLLYAKVMGTEDALVRHHFMNGSHAIATALYALLRPGDLLLAATGDPYDTLMPVILCDNCGSLKELGVGYSMIPLECEDHPGRVEKAVRELSPAAVLIQRSRGYASRPALSPDYINDLCDRIHSIKPGCRVIVDNCYGEFTRTVEPYRADLICGSLIKNPGGGLAPNGGYVAGRKECVELAAYRLGVPGSGREVGSNPFGYRLYYQGLFAAPQAVSEALKTSVFAARVLELAGFEPSPDYDAECYDIIRAINFGSPEPMLAFIRGIQSGAPVDSFVTPEPWDMPGYDDPVVMAAGAFVQGASIELSADGPMRPPYTAFLQGGLTYESGRLGIIRALKEILKDR